MLAYKERQDKERARSPIRFESRAFVRAAVRLCRGRPCRGHFWNGGKSALVVNILDGIGSTGDAAHIPVLTGSVIYDRAQR